MKKVFRSAFFSVFLVVFLGCFFRVPFVFSQTQSHTVTMDWMGFADDFEQGNGSEQRDNGGASLITVSRWSGGSVVTDGTQALEVSSVFSVAGHSEWTDINYRAKMKTTAPGAQTWNVGRLLFHYQDASNYYAVLLHNDAGVGRLELAANKAGVWNPGLASVNTGLSPAAWHNFRVLMRGSIVRVWVDGVEYINYTDASPVTGGQVGIVGDSSTAHLDDVVVNYLGTSTVGRCLRDGTADANLWNLQDTTNFKTRYYKSGNMVYSLWRNQGVRWDDDFDDTTSPYNGTTKVAGVWVPASGNVACTTGWAFQAHAREQGGIGTEDSDGYAMLERVFTLKGYANTDLPSFSATSSDLQFSYNFNSCFAGAGSACDMDNGADYVFLYSYLVPEDVTQGGLYREGYDQGEYFTGENWGQPQVNPKVGGAVTSGVSCGTTTFCMDWGTGAGWTGGPADYWLLRFDGKIYIPTTGSWQFQCGADDGCRLFIDGEVWVTMWRSGGFTWSGWNAAITLNKGYHDIRVEYFDKTSGAKLEVQWTGPGVAAADIPFTNLYYPSKVYKLQGAQTGNVNTGNATFNTNRACGTNQVGVFGCDYIEAWDPTYFSNPNNDTHLNVSLANYCTNDGFAPSRCTTGTLASYFNTIGTTSRRYKSRFYVPIFLEGAAGNHEKFVLLLDDIRFNFTYSFTWPAPTFSIASRAWGNTDVNVSVTYPQTVDVEYTRHCWNNGSTCDPGTTNANTFTNGQTLTQTAEGSWYLCTRAGDMRGNWSNATCNGTYQIDKTAPAVTFNAPAASSWQKADFALNVSDSDALSGLSSCEYMVESYNGTSWVTTKSWTARTCNSSTSATVTVLASTGDCRNEGTGTCRVTVRATDVALNVNTLSARLFSIDWTAPALTVNSPSASSWQKADFAANVSDSDATSGLASCEYMVESYNGTSWVQTKPASGWTARTCNSATSATITVLASTGDCRDQGTDKCRVSFRSTDAAGNVTGTTQRLFSIDWTAPSFTLTGWTSTCSVTQYTNGESYSDATPCFSYAASDTGSGLAATPYTTIWSSGINCSTTPSTLTASSTYAPAALTSVDKYCFSVKAADAAGNVSSVSTFTYIYNTVTPSWRYPGIGSQVGTFYGGGTIRSYGAEQRFYGASYSGILYAIDAASAGPVATPKWSYDLTSPTNYGVVSSPPLIFGGKIYLGTESGYVLRLTDNGASATIDESRNLGACAIQSATMTITLSGATKILVGCGANIYALNDDATFTNWTAWSVNPRPLTGNVTRSIPAYAVQPGGVDPYLYVASQNGTLVDALYGNLYRVDINTGVILNTFSDATDFAGFLILRNYFGGGQWIYTGGANSNKFYAIRTSAIPASCTAPNCYSFAASSGFEGGAAASSGGSVIYAGNNNGTLYRLNFNGSSLTSPYNFNAGGAVKYGVTFRQTTGRLYFGTDAGLFFIVTDNGASFTENMRYQTGASVSATPAVNSTAGKVVIPSTIGRIFSFGL